MKKSRLSKLSELIEEAQELTDKLFTKTNYSFYQNLSIELCNIQGDLDKQSITEEIDTREQ